MMCQKHEERDGRPDPDCEDCDTSEATLFDVRSDKA
jgi:hypothetical protein